MSHSETLHRIFRSDTRVRQQAQEWAQLRFFQEDRHAAQIVGYALTETLGLPLQQIEPSSDIISDFGANESAEWIEIQQSVEEQLNGWFRAEPAFRDRTVADLVNFVRTHELVRSNKKPKRRILTSRDWCFAACVTGSLAISSNRQT